MVDDAVNGIVPATATMGDEDSMCEGYSGELFTVTYPLLPGIVEGGEATAEEEDTGDAENGPNALCSLPYESGECSTGRVCGGLINAVDKVYWFAPYKLSCLRLPSLPPYTYTTVALLDEVAVLLILLL